MNRGNKGKKAKTTKGVEGRGKELGVQPPPKKLATEEEVEAHRKRQVLGNITNAAQKQNKTARPGKENQIKKVRAGRKEPKSHRGEVQEKAAKETAAQQQAEEDRSEDDILEEDRSEEDLLEEDRSEEDLLEEDEQQEEGEDVSLSEEQEEEEEQEETTELSTESEATGANRPRGFKVVLSGSTLEQETDFRADEPLEKYQSSIPRNPPIPSSRPVPDIQPPEDFKFRYDSSWIAKHLPPDSKVISYIPPLQPVPTHLGVKDIDGDRTDWTGMSIYAREIFEYYRLRERKFLVEPYMSRQASLTPHMRAILVDWLVELQENYELNHETLYLGVRIIDAYLARVQVPKERLQITGAVCLYIACKYDVNRPPAHYMYERIPPSLDDLIYVCDNVYDGDEFMELEREVFRTIDFEIGMPLSYRFLRRYARCAEISMETLTLARYILEMSLMDYQFVGQLESKMAASALYLALRMKNEGSWDINLQFHTNYKREQLMTVVERLNGLLTNKHFSDLKTVRSKYSHRVFHNVAKIPTLRPDQL